MQQSLALAAALAAASAGARRRRPLAAPPPPPPSPPPSSPPSPPLPSPPPSPPSPPPPSTSPSPPPAPSSPPPAAGALAAAAPPATGATCAADPPAPSSPPSPPPPSPPPPPFPPASDITAAVADDEGEGVSTITLRSTLVLLLKAFSLICYICNGGCRRREKQKEAAVLTSGDSMLEEESGEKSLLPDAARESKGIGARGRCRTTMMAMKNWLGTALGSDEELANPEDSMPAPPPLTEEIAADLDRITAQERASARGPALERASALHV